MSDDVLIHYGIKGMKWGKRRFQNKDGSLTQAGKKRYSDDQQNSLDKKSNIIERHRNKLIEHYKERGYSQVAAETAAKQRMRTEMFVGAVGAVAVGVIVHKAAVRIGQDYIDKTIKSGKIIQNVNANEHTTFRDDPFFAAINKHDKKAYGSLYPNEKRTFQLREGNKNPEIFKNQIKLKEDVKVASVNNARKVFEDKMKSDPSFRDDVISTLKKTAYGERGKKEIRQYENSGKIPKRLYDRFNQALATPQMQESGLHKKFYSELKSKGYDAILDINDTRYSGYTKISKSPTIFFGNEKLEKLGSTKLSDVEINKNFNKYMTKFMLKNQGKQVMSITGVAAAYKAMADQKAIDAYLDEHPNSKLSEKEILEAYREQLYSV